MNLKGQEKNLSVSCVDIRSDIDYTEQCVRLCSDVELMSLQINISRRIKDNVEEHSKPGNSLEPVEVVDVGCAKALQQLCQKSKITCPADYIVVDKIPSIIEVHKEIKIEVVTTVLEPTKSNITLECQSKCFLLGQYTKPRLKKRTQVDMKFPTHLVFADNMNSQSVPMANQYLAAHSLWLSIYLLHNWTILPRYGMVSWGHVA